MTSTLSAVILAMRDKKPMAVREIAKRTLEIIEDKKVNINRWNAVCKYQLDELASMGIAESSKHGRWITYKLCDEVEILKGTMILKGESGDVKYEDNVNDVLRMMEEDGDVVIKILV